VRKPAVYLETGFINRLADPLKRDPHTRQQQLDSREWWQTYRRRYTLVTSDTTLQECLEYSNPRIVRLRLRYLTKTGRPRLLISEVNALSTVLRQPHGPLPSAELFDANHLAPAAVLCCRFLLTWNQKHLANPFNRDRIDTIIKEHGYQPPTIVTPEQFLQATLE
jgi:hypothetical protein